MGAVLLLGCSTISVRAQAPGSAAPDTTPGLELGTGFVIGRDGAVLTTAHEVEGCRSVSVLARDAQPVAARDVASDRQADLAVIHAPLAHPLAPLPLRTETEITVGETLFLLGYPLQRPLRLMRSSFFASLASGVGGINGDPSVFRLPFVVLPGMSGAAVLDGGGRVVGMVKTHLIETLPNNGPALGGESFATSGSVIASFVAARNIPAERGAGSQTLSAPEIAVRAIASSVIVLCQR